MSISGPVSVGIHDMTPAKLLVAGFSSSGMFSVLRRPADVLAEVEIRAQRGLGARVKTAEAAMKPRDRALPNH
jgi:hypothetical protein